MEKNKYVSLLDLLSRVDHNTRKEFINDLLLYNVACFTRDDNGNIIRKDPTKATDDDYFAFNAASVAHA